jgi:hypothetical protein
MSSLHKIKYTFTHSTTRHVHIFSFSQKCITKSCLSIENLSRYKISWSHVDWLKFWIHLCSLKILPWPYSKCPLKKTIIQIKLVGMSTIFHCTKFCLSKCNGSRVLLASEDLSKYNIPWSYDDWCKFCIHLNSLNVRHFGMLAATEFKSMASSSSSMA